MRNWQSIGVRRPSPALVISVIALIAALAGTAGAANTISSTDIIDGEVKTPDLALDAVVSNRIANGQVKAGDLDTDAVRSAKIANGQVRAPDIATNEVGFDEVSPSAFAAGDIAAHPQGRFGITNGAIQAAEIDPQAFIADDINEAGASGRYGIAADAIESQEIANGQVRAPDLGPIKVRKTTINCPDGPAPPCDMRPTVECHSGEQVISGGFVSHNTFTHAIESRRAGNGWRVWMIHHPTVDDNDTPPWFDVRAHCLAIGL